MIREMKAWKDLVLKWLSCFAIEPLKNIEDIKERNILVTLDATFPQKDDDRFACLLKYLNNHYPNYGSILFDSQSACWSEEKDLILVSTLLLLHASIYNPSPSFQQNAAQNLNSAEQELIVAFLEKAMHHNQHLTRNILIECIPTGGDSSSHPSTPTPGQHKKRRSRGTPLADFLSSPVARQKRQTGNFRDRLSQLENDLEQEQAEKIALQQQMQQKDAQINELGRKYKEKSDEVKSLQEEIQQALEGQDAHKGNQLEEKIKLRQELANSEVYISKLEEEIGALKTLQYHFQQKLATSEVKSSEWEALVRASQDELHVVKSQMLQQSEENVELSAKCKQLERDLNQIQSSHLLSPRRSGLDSPSQRCSITSPGSAPESLGFIVERQMIDTENENDQLKKSVTDLEEQLRNLKVEYSDLHEKYEHDRDSASRALRKSEIKLENLVKDLDATSIELKGCKKNLEELSSKFADTCAEKNTLSIQLQDMSQKKSSLMSELRSLQDIKHSLEVKVAQQDAKLQMSAEREEELHEIAKRRVTELGSMKQDMDDMEVKLKASLKEQVMIEQQLHDTVRKLNLIKNVEIERDDLEEQVLALKLSNTNFEKQLQSINTSAKESEEKLLVVVDEKRAIESQLKDVLLKKNDLASLLEQVTTEKGDLVNENLSLQTEKVRWESELQEAASRIQEAENKCSKEKADKKNIQNKLAEAIATNDRLSSKLSILSQQESDLGDNLRDVLKQKKSIENQLSSISTEKERLEAELKETCAQLTKISCDRESLSHALAMKTSELEEMSLKFSDLVNNKVGLETKLACENAEKEKLHCQLTEIRLKLELTQSELSNVKTELGLLHEQCEEKACALQDLETEKSDIEDDLCHYVGRLNVATEENLSLRSEISGLKEEKEKLSIACEELTKIKSDFEEKIALMEAEQMSFSQEKETLHTKLKSVSEERDDVISELNNTKNCVTNLEADLSAVKSTNSELQQEVSVRSLQIEVLLGEKETMKENFLVKHKCLQQEIDENAQQLSILKGEISEMQINYKTLEQQKKKLEEDYQLLVHKNSKLEEDISEYISRIDVLTQEKANLSDTLSLFQSEKTDALSWVENVEKENKSLISQLEIEKNLRKEVLSDLEEKATLLTHLQTSDESKEKLMTDCQEKLSVLKEDKDKLFKEMEAIVAEKDELSSRCEQFRTEVFEKEAELQLVRNEMIQKTQLVQEELIRHSEDNKFLKAEIAAMDATIQELNKKLQASSDDAEAERKLTDVISMKDIVEGQLTQAQLLIQEHEESLKKAHQEREFLNSQINTLQKTSCEKNEDFCKLQKSFETLTEEVIALHNEISEKDQIISSKDAIIISLRNKSDGVDKVLESDSIQHLKEDLQTARCTAERLSQDLSCVQKNFEEEKLRLEKALEDALSEVKSTKQMADNLISEKDQIISSKDAIIISLRNKLDGVDKVLESDSIQHLKEDLHTTRCTTERLSQELSCVQKNFEEEKLRLEKALEDALSEVKITKQMADNLQQKLAVANSGGKLEELQQEETLWQLDRVKNSLSFRFDSIIIQKTDLEDHLSQLRTVLEDVGHMCDTLFSALPSNCNAVHEVTIMRKEVESKLRAVDKKYADSLCGIITLAHEMFKWTRKQTDIALSESGSTCVDSLLLSEKDSIDTRLGMLSEVMISLTCDVRSVINSCKFLSERCESYLKAQTRESLKIKTSVVKDGVRDILTENNSQTSETRDSRLSPSNDSGKSSEQLDSKSDSNLQSEKEISVEGNSDWFGGAATLYEGYSSMKRSHTELEKQITDLHAELKKQQSTSQRPQDDLEQKVVKLQEKVNALMLRPTREQLDEKLKELHGQYSLKLEAMKEKMKQIVKDEVDKVEEAKIRSEKEIVAKYSKRISEFEEHVQELSAQLWELGEKLLQEQHDHKAAKERLAAMKERQRRFLMSKPHTQSLDRLDLLLQGSDNASSNTFSKRRCLSQTTQTATQTATSFSNVHTQSDASDVDEAASKRSTMMAPASMGLAFPEEDEDGEVFNNDYLAELKEGRCRAPLDGSRLSELQYRNSLCPPHLKSSYPLETQFHDPHMYKDEDLKGPEARSRRPGKDRGTKVAKWPKQSLSEQKRMLLQLRHALARPKSGRRSIIHPRNHWSEIRDLRNSYRRYLRPPLNHKISSNIDALPDLRADTRYPFLPHISLPSSQKEPNLNLPKPYVLLRGSVRRSASRKKECSKCSTKAGVISLKPPCAETIKFKGGNSAVCPERQKSGPQKFKFSTPETPRSFPSLQRAKNLRANLKRSRFLSDSRPLNKVHVSIERKLKWRNPKRQGWMDLMPSKSPRNHHVKSPYLVCPCVPFSKTYIAKPKVRSLLRLEQTPAFQVPPRISLKGSCASSGKRTSLKEQGSGVDSTGKKNAKKTQRGRGFSHFDCGKFNASVSTVLRRQTWNITGTQKKLCPAESLTPKLKKSGTSEVKSKIERKPISKDVYLKINCPRLSNNRDVLTSAYQINGKEKAKLIKLCSKGTSNQSEAKCCTSSENFKKVHRTHKYLERVEARLLKFPLLSHGPGRVLAERLACDKRIMSSKAKWNSPADARSREVFKNKSEPIINDECRLHLPVDSGIQCDTSAKLGEEVTINPKLQKNLETLNSVPIKFQMCLNPVMPFDAHGSPSSLSPPFPETLQLRGKLVERVMSRFGRAGERNDRLCELVHALLPGVETSYKKPGPPTPSKKAGRLSLQGKEDLTPRVALREHNESQASQGTGMLRAKSSTPSRLRALFTSSKVANAATLPTKKDESSTPATPTSKRLSIFRKRFGSNKENQNASSGYSSFR